MALVSMCASLCLCVSVFVCVGNASTLYYLYAPLLLKHNSKSREAKQINNGVSSVAYGIPLQAVGYIRNLFMWVFRVGMWVFVRKLYPQNKTYHILYLYIILLFFIIL